MSFLLSQNAPALNVRGANDVALLHKLECRACPLDKTFGSKIAPTGAERPLVYILGEAAGKHEAEEQEQFVGDSGQILRSKIPRAFRDKVRFNNTVRSRPENNATPDFVMIECCRPSVQKDIEQSRPRAIFGFGNIPLEWVSGFSGTTLWRGRRMPVKVGKHVCWFYSMLHPAYLLHSRRKGNVSEEEHIFGLDMARAFAEVENLPPPIVHSAEDARRNVEIITEGGAVGLAKVKAALAWAAKLPVVGMDYETSCLRPYEANAKILTAAVANGDRAIAFPIDHPEATWNKAEREEIGHYWGRFLKEAKGVKAVHNAAFEMEWTAVEFGPELLYAGKWGDTATQASILDERKGNKKAGPLSLEFLVQQYFGFNLKKIAGVDRKNLESTPLEAVLLYNAPDARYHCLLWEKQAERLEQEDLSDVYELGLRRVPSVVLAQYKGVTVDQTEVARLKKKYTDEIRKSEEKIKALPVVKEFERKRGRKFNPQSNPDTLFVLKDLLHRPEIIVENKYTKKQEYSTEENVLSKIHDPFAEAMLRLRKFNKRYSVYVAPLEVGSPTSTVYPDGLLHAQFNTFFAETGRFSCEGPNLQNFPKRDKEVPEAVLSKEELQSIEVRKQIVAEPGHVILAFDYGQIEARVIAMFTKDKVFCQQLWEGYDVHMDWTERLAYAYPARIGGKRYLKDKLALKKFRGDIKNQWTFPLVYGAKAESAAGYLSIPEHIIRPQFNQFWKEFAGIKEWQERQIEFYKKWGYVECLTGRRRRGPLSTNQILNNPVQGTAAEIFADSMDRLSSKQDMLLQPEINVHDDLTFIRVPLKKVDFVAEAVITEMLAVPFEWAKIVPITVEMSVGTDWMNMEEVGTYSSNEWFS